MKLGFFTPCMKDRKLEDILKFARQNGFGVLEVACWPKKSDRDYFGNNIDVITLDQDKAKQIKEMFQKYGITISSLGYYDNNLSADLKKRKSVNDHVKKVIDAAVLLDTNLVGTFVGRNHEITEAENFDEFKKYFAELIKYAEDKNVKLMIENCPMVGWQKEFLPGTISYSLEQWDKMFEIFPTKNFGLNYDPSHLYWLGIDCIKPLNKYKDRIFHVHAKDTEILDENLKTKSILAKGWWRARMPGLGDIDWNKFIATLQVIGYDGAISIEHEDPIWRGSEEKVNNGLIIAARTLLPLIV